MVAARPVWSGGSQGRGRPFTRSPMPPVSPLATFPTVLFSNLSSSRLDPGPFLFSSTSFQPPLFSLLSCCSPLVPVIIIVLLLGQLLLFPRERAPSTDPRTRLRLNRGARHLCEESMLTDTAHVNTATGPLRLWRAFSTWTVFRRSLVPRSVSSSV